jgi:hypothetical protein
MPFLRFVISLKEAEIELGMHRKARMDRGHRDCLSGIRDIPLWRAMNGEAVVRLRRVAIHIEGVIAETVDERRQLGADAGQCLFEVCPQRRTELSALIGV